MAERRLLRGGCAVLLLLGAALVGYGLGARHVEVPPPTRSAHAQAPSAVDIGFAQDMSTHHAQALVMAGMALDAADDPQLLALARGILVDQSREIGVLQGWLTAWAAPLIPTASPMTWMAGGHDHGDAMPGMATQAQLDRLHTRHGTAFDRLFATLMIRHHEGGVLMATYAENHAGLAETRSFARVMTSDQTKEIALLRAVLASS
jgi:uncharacterized protein (DUF305 family)